jgi:hypothetical protein
MVNNGLLGTYTPADMYIIGLSYAGFVFVAALMGSPTTKSSPLDLWGNVKIPRIEAYEGTARMNDEGWYDVESGDGNAYSSVIGIPIEGLNETGFIDYVTRIHSPYLSLQCSLNTTFIDGRSSFSDRGLPGFSSSFAGSGFVLFWDLNARNISNSSQELERDEISLETTLPLRVKYVPMYPSNFTFVCNVTQSYVEAEIRCPTPSTCASSRVRRSRLDHFPPAWTLLDIS